MSAPARPPLLEVFHPRVRAFRAADYALESDLGWLDRLRALGAAEGIVLYCVRILEVLAREAVAALFVPGERLADNLNLLHDYDWLPGAALRPLHRLRALGNDARHALRPLSRHDAELGYGIVLRALHWYFCEFRHGPRLRTLTVHNGPLETLLPASVADLLERLDAQLDEAAFLDSLRLDQPDPEVLLSPLVPALLVETLLGRSRLDEARRVLRAALDRFGSDPRLRQLQGLYLSRSGDLAQARACLEAIPTTGTPADEETLGILAGVVKRQWQARPKDRATLTRCQQLYRQGWERSQARNPYLGINAATTALWNRQPGVARALAEQVRALLEGRQRCLAQGEDARGLSYWDEVTLAEACLLLDDREQARRHYRAACTRHAAQVDNIRVSREQARAILQALGRPEEVGELLPE
jgi:hypothetical protein